MTEDSYMPEFMKGNSSDELDYLSMNAIIKVMGVGTFGCHLIRELMKQDVGDIDLIAADTDKCCLDLTDAHHHVQLGTTLTRGFGTGGDLERGRTAALEAKGDIKKLVEDANMLFLLAGMGGGTGSGAAPVIADIARDMGVLTVAIVTLPFAIERDLRMEKADKGLASLIEVVDTAIVIPNDILLSQLEPVARAGRYVH